MFTDENGNILIYVKIHLPWAPDPIEKRIKLARRVFRSFEPLPEDRDLDDVFGNVTRLAREEAMDMQRDRIDVAEIVSKQLSTAILEAVRSRDPQHGYPPEQWAKINPTPTPSPANTDAPSTAPGPAPAATSGNHIPAGSHHTAGTSATADHKSDSPDKP